MLRIYLEVGLLILKQKIPGTFAWKVTTNTRAWQEQQMFTEKLDLA